MKPVEFVSSEDLMSVYMIVKYHPYFRDLAFQNGGRLVSKNDEWVFVYNIPMPSFLAIYKDIAEGFPVKLDLFLEQTLGDKIKGPRHVFSAPMIQPSGILPHIKPMGYQTEAFSHAVHYKKSIVGLPVGAGKSLVGKMFKEHLDTHFTLICPASIKYQWKKEIKDMTGKDALVIDGTPKKRAEQYRASEWFEWIIINYETLVSDEDKVPRRNGVIIDEAHYLKNPTSKRTIQTMRYIEDVDNVLLLTGTFLVNSLLDGWSLMRMLGRVGKFNRLVGMEEKDIIKAINKEFFMFRKFNCILDTYNNPIGFKPEIGIFKKNLRSVTYYRQKEEIMPDLPKRNDNFIDIQMLPEQKKFYQKLEDGILENLTNPEEEQEVDAMALFTRLRQAAADPHMIFPEADKKKKLSAKIEWLKEWLESFDERTLIIYSPFESFLERIKEELPDYPWVLISGKMPVKKREELIEGARNSNEKTFFLITDAVKTGKNIQFCQHFIFATLPLTWADYDQLRGRIWRKGQDYPVFIYHLMGLETIDHSNWELIEGKKNLMDDFKISKFGAADLEKAIRNKKKE